MTVIEGLAAFNGGGGREGAAVQAVEKMRSEIMRNFGRLAYAGDHHKIFRRDIQARQGLV